MIDIHVHSQVGNFWRFKYSDPVLDEVPKFKVLIDFPKIGDPTIGKLFGFQFPIPANAIDYLVQAYGESWRIPVGYKEYHKIKIKSK